MTSKVVGNDEAAALIGVTPGTLKVWRSRGKGPRFLKYGTARQAGVGYEVSDIEAWKEANKFASTTECSPAARRNACLTTKRSVGATG